MGAPARIYQRARPARAVPPISLSYSPVIVTMA